MGPNGSGKEALALVKIVKRFGSVRALAGVDFEVDAGEVHALLGENGAGKTTLMNVASGVLRPDSGEIRIGSRQLTLRTPRDSFAAGLGMVHQNLRLIDIFSVAENVHLGWDEAPAVASARVLEQRTEALSDSFGLDVNPSALVSDLSLGEKQRVAILRTLARGAKTLVLDEPTAALTPAESRQLFAIVRRLVGQGHSVVFISHKLREVMELATRITVLRGGQRVATLPVADATMEKLARLMVGHSVTAGVVDPHAPVEPNARPQGGLALAAKGVSASTPAGVAALSDVDLELYGGEILGVAGVSGNGQSELAEVLSGLLPTTAGSLTIDSQDMTGKPPNAFIRAGVGHIPEDPRTGLAFGERLDANAVLKSIDEPEIGRGPLLRWSKIRELATTLLTAAGLGNVSPDRTARTLSGGQAQRLLVQREIRAGRRILISVHPTRGLDVAATQQVQESLAAARSRGSAALLISEDLDEVLALSDHIVVLYEGRIMGRMVRGAFDRNRIGELMGGHDGDAPATGHRQ